MLSSVLGSTRTASAVLRAAGRALIASVLGLGVNLSEVSAEPATAATLALLSTSLPQDSFTWLDEIQGERALAWVHEQNTRSLKALQQDPRYMRYYEEALRIVQDKRHIPGTSPVDRLKWHEGWLYAYWSDEQHPRGVWRRTSFESYRSANPEWQNVLDLDALAKAEGKAWGLYQADCLGSRCLIWLSDGGDVAFTVREFDLESRTFVKGGFVLPPRNPQYAVWKNEHTLLVAADFGPGTLATDGSPMIVKEWSRGEPLSAARERFRSERSDAGVSLRTVTSERGERSILILQSVDALQFKWWELPTTGKAVRMHVPPSANVSGRYRGEWLCVLLADWSTWRKFTLLSIPNTEMTSPDPTVRIVMEAAPQEVLSGAMTVTQAGVLAPTLQHVRGRLWRLDFEDGRWQREPIALPEHGVLGITLVDPRTPLALVTYQDAAQPVTIYAVDVAAGRATPLKSVPAHFAAERYLTEQLEATSADGTRVPYFLVRPKGFKPNGRAPTLMHGYGASGGSSLPFYDGPRGRLWLDQGGLYVIANIRGGGELGPDWNVRKTERRRTYEDFIAVAEDLIRRNITSPRHLGIWGHSNGGMLMGVMLNQRPELFHAAVIQNPVLDLIGWEVVYNGVRVRAASLDTNIFQYGSLEVPEERAYIEQTSPYQNLKRREHFPLPFIATSTTDVQVTPGMARKYAARMASLSMPFLYYESPEGGHDVYVTSEQHALWEALVYTYLAQRLM